MRIATSLEQRHGLRVVTINVHSGVPGGVPLGDEREDERTIADVARYVRSIDADVVLLQEVDDDPPRPGKAGVPHQVDLYAARMGATDVAYAPAFRHRSGDRYGNAVLVRNGVRILDRHDVDLPNPKMAEDRAAAVVRIAAPDGREALVVATHLAHRPAAESDRPEQLRFLAGFLGQLRAGGAVAYEDAITGARSTVDVPVGIPILLGGDFNTGRGTVTSTFGPVGMQLVASGLTGVAGVNGGIDHLLVTPGVVASGARSELVPTHDLPDGLVTDHPAVLVDLDLPA